MWGWGCHGARPSDPLLSWLSKLVAGSPAPARLEPPLLPSQGDTSCPAETQHLASWGSSVPLTGHVCVGQGAFQSTGWEMGEAAPSEGGLQEWDCLPRGGWPVTHLGAVK